MRQTTRLLQTVLIMGGLLILVLAAPEVQSRTIQSGQPQNAVHLASIPSATPHTAQLFTYLPLSLDSYTFPVPPEPPFGEEPHAVVGSPYALVVIFGFSPIFSAPSASAITRTTLPADIRSLHPDRIGALRGEGLPAFDHPSPGAESQRGRRVCRRTRRLLANA